MDDDDDDDVSLYPSKYSSIHTHIQITANDIFFLSFSLSLTPGLLPSVVILFETAQICHFNAIARNSFSKHPFNLHIQRETNYFSYYVTQYYCILLLDVFVLPLCRWDAEHYGSSQGISEQSFIHSPNSHSLSKRHYVLHVAFIWQPVSSPFNIIFTIQNDYTSYSFMSSHINDFIMCSIALRLVLLTGVYSETVNKTGHVLLVYYECTDAWAGMLWLCSMHAANWMALSSNECESNESEVNDVAQHQQSNEPVIAHMIFSLSLFFSLCCCVVTSIIFRYIFSTNYAYSHSNRHNVHSLDHTCL